MNKKDLLTVRLTLGEKIMQVQARSTYRFDLERILDEDVLMITGPVEFECLHPMHSFILPPSFLVSLTTYAAQVCAVRAMPHLEYLKLEEAFRLCAELTVLFECAGWKRSEEDYPSLDTVKETVTFLEAKLNYTVLVQEWKVGYDNVLLLLRRHYKAGLDPHWGDQDLFFVIVVLDNIIVRNQALKQTLTQRNTDGVDPKRPRFITIE